METIINFLEQYWGYTLVGGVSLGTIITFTITQIKVLIKDKNKNKAVDTVVSTADNLCAELNAREERRDVEMKKLSNKLEEQQTELHKKEEYFEKVQAATFQAISYLIIASKLPTEDKIAIQQKFTNLVNNKVVEYVDVIKNNVEEEVADAIVPDATKSIEETVEETKSLLDKYMKEG